MGTGEVATLHAREYGKEGQMTARNAAIGHPLGASGAR